MRPPLLPTATFVAVAVASGLAAGCDRPALSDDDGVGGVGDEGGGDGFTGGCGDQQRPSAQQLTTDDRVDGVLSAMTLADKVDQMAGFDPGAELFATPDNEQHGIRGIKFRDGPRGVRLDGDGTATCFPVAMARGATFDRDLERRVGAAMAREVKALGHNLLLAPTVNTLRHPAWGRGQETYGEDPLHLGVMGAVFTQGVQGEGVPACVKHLAGNNLEDTRMTNNAVIDEQNLRENYLRQFRIVVEQGDPACVMSAYNKVNGLYCSENGHLMRDILKDEWGFDGFVVSDWGAVHSTIESAVAGLDIEMPFRSYYADLASAVDSGQLDERFIDDAVRRILRVKFRYGFALLEEPWTGDPAVVESDEHIALTKEAAIKGSVLLKNQGALLPLDRSSVGKIAVVGVWSDKERLGDSGSSKVVPSYAVPPFQGIAAVAGDGVEVVQSTDASAAIGADVAIVIGALTPKDEGEAIFGGGDRDSLSLSAGHEALIQEVTGLADRTLVVLEAGGPITMQPWLDQVDALVMAWYPGQEGGTALGELIFGDSEFSGRLPQTWPADEGDEPEFGNQQPETEYAYLHGYRHFIAHGITPLFPFGFGLSYTTFEYRDLTLSCGEVTPGARLTAQVTIANTGDRPGAEVVQLYATFPDDGARRLPLQLVAFERVELAAGEEKTVTIPVWVADLAYYDEAGRAWVVAPGEHRLHAGPNSGDLPLAETFSVGDEGQQAGGGGGEAGGGDGGGGAQGGNPVGAAQVTFQVDMAGFDPPGGVYVQGAFNDWCGLCQPLSDLDDDGVWTLTLPLDEGEHAFQFTTAGWAGLIEDVPADCADDTGHRTVLVGQDDVDAPVHYFGGCTGEQNAPPTAQDLTITVDMTGWPQAGGVYVQARWNGWCGDCQPLDDAGQSSFTGTFGIPPGDHDYALVTHAGQGLTEPVPADCDPDPGDGRARRSVVVTDRPVVTTSHLWGRCAGDDTPPPAPVAVEFRADVAGDGFLQADFNGWCIDCAPLDEAGSRTEQLPPGSYPYRFATAEGPETLAPGCDLDPADSRNARVINVGADPVQTPVHTLGSCQP